MSDLESSPRVPTEAERAALRAWLDREPACDECGGIGGHTGSCLAPDAHRTRRSDVTGALVVLSWRSWFDADVCECGHAESEHFAWQPECVACACRAFTPRFLGERSARVGPDAVDRWLGGRCGCPICRGTNSTKESS